MVAELEQAFREQRGALLALARRMVRSDADAEDVLQLAFENALRHHQSFERRAALTSWLYRITYNTALMFLRSRRRKGAESLDAFSDEVQSVLVSRARVDSLDQDAEVVAEQRELRAALNDAFGHLSATDQRIVRMRLEEHWSTGEVADAVGLTATATKTRLHRARAELRAHLEGAVAVAA